MTSTFLIFQCGNLERCLSILAAESDRFLYGGNIDVLDSPMPVQPSSQNTPIDEPISIAIPQPTNTPYLPNRTAPPPLQPMIRPMTVAQSSSGVGRVSSCPLPGERQPPSAVASYDQSMYSNKLQITMERKQRISHCCPRRVLAQRSKPEEASL